MKGHDVGLGEERLLRDKGGAISGGYSLAWRWGGFSITVYIIIRISVLLE